MGLRGEQRPSGLACVLFDSPRDGAERVTALDAQRLASDLQAAVEYVFHGGAGAAAADNGPPPLVRDGCIDYDAVAQHVQRAVHAAAGLSPPLPAAQEEQAASEGQQEQEQACSSIDASRGSDSSAGSEQSRDEPPRLAASDSSGSEPCSPVAGPRAAAASAAGQSEPAASAAARSSGRLGPAEVGLVEARGNCDIAGTHVTSRSNFATVRSNACVFRGRWQYEVQLGSAGIMQLGWTTLAARFNTEEGVGDNHDSYAYDGRRRMRWHASNNAYGEHWVAGDVIGCCLDLDAGTMRFYRNGKDLGEAFANVRRGMPGMAYFAGVSLSYAERCELNFGGRPFLFPVGGYQPLQHQVPDRYQQLQTAALGGPDQQPQQQQQGQEQGQGPPGAARLSRQQQVAVARYLAGCLSRLMDVGASPPAAGEAGGTEAALDDGPGGAPAEGAAVAADMPASEQALLFPAAAGPLPSAASQLPDADLIAALAAAAGEPGGSKPAAPAGGAAHAALTLPAASGHGAGPAIRIDDCVLLGAVLARHLGPLCFDPYCMEAVLLPLLDDAAGELAGGGFNISGKGSADGNRSGDDAAEAAQEAEGAAAEPAIVAAAGPGQGGVQELGRQRLAQLLGLLEAVLEPEELAALVTHCCQVLGRRVRGCRWALAELPRSDALGALRLWGAMIECQAIREAWLASSEWHAQLEQLMCVRQPSEEDLTQLFSNLKVAWSEGGAGVVRSRPEDEAAFTADLNKIATGLDELEAAQADLLLQLWLEPSRGAAHGSSACEYDSSRTNGDEDGSSAEGDSRGGLAAVQQVPPASDEVSPSTSDAATGAEAVGAAVEAGRLAAAPALAEAESAEAGGSGAAAPAPEARESAESTAAAGSAQPPAPPLPPLSPRRHQQTAQEAAGEPQAGCYLRQWLQHLADKNHGAMRHIPPPGLSDQTALVSTVFALLRLMNEQVTASPTTSSAGFRLSELPLLRWDPASTFLTGGALGGGGDPYRDAGRLGGTLSHLAREHPPTDEDRQPLHPLDMAAVVNYDAALRLAPRAKEGPSFADVWLRDRLLMLCHLSAAPLMRSGLSHLAAMQAAMAGLRAVSAEGGGRMMEETRRQCQQEFVRSRRAHEWAQCWLLSPWHQQAAFVLAVDTSRLLQRVSEQRQGLLRYVPELYVSACLDMVHAVHRFEPAVLDHAAMLGLGLRHVITFVVCHLEDERIVSPEVQSRLLNMVLDGVQELDLLRELGGDPVSRSRLVPAMMRLFGRPQLWGPVSNFFALLVEGNGFMHPPPAFPAEFGEPLGKLRRLFMEACLADADLCERFTHHLFDNANRMLTELVASLENMESSWTRGAGPSPQLLRLLSSTADYALVLLRVVEMMAAEMPQLFLGRSDMNLTRLAEVVGFAVPQFVLGRAHRALQRVAANRLAAHLRLREAHLLQPLAGTLAVLWQAEREEHAQQEAQQQEPAERRAAEPPAAAEQPPQQAQVAQRRRLSLAGALDRQAALTDDVFRGLLDVELSQVEPLSAEAAAAAAEAAAEGGETPAEQRRRQEGDLRRLRDMVDGLLRRRAEAAAAAASDGRGGGGGGGLHAAGHAADSADAPEEFLDPILQTLMQDPVLLPDSRITLDRATIERHLLSSATDPFSRAPLSKDQLIPNTELRQQIEAWLQQLEDGSSGSRGSSEAGSGPDPSGTASAGAGREDNGE